MLVKHCTLHPLLYRTVLAPLGAATDLRRLGFPTDKAAAVMVVGMGINQHVQRLEYNYFLNSCILHGELLFLALQFLHIIYQISYCLVRSMKMYIVFNVSFIIVTFRWKKTWLGSGWFGHENYFLSDLQSTGGSLFFHKIYLIYGKNRIFIK